ncbi:MAG: hypothetical protein E6H87_08895 [Chloroflexi bacterium]|nr:MAG: hypothetical protein E6H87_08895 [Chloroflexota bacterium]
MTEFSDDALARRIATLAVPLDVSRVSQRALAARRKPRGLSIRWRVLAAVPLALLLVSAAASYYAPVFAQALADAPLAGSISGPMLRQFGLAGMPHRVSAFGDRVTSGGYTAELVGGYADAARTILFVRIDPPARAFAPFGEIRLATVGARLHVAFTSIEEGLPPASRTIAGRWDLTGTLAVDEGLDLTAPGPIQLGGARLSFTRVRALAVGLLVEFKIDPVDIDEFNREIPDGLKGRPAFRVSLVDANGRERQQLGGASEGGGTDRSRMTVTGSWLWQTEGSGNYVLSVDWEGVGSGTRTIPVP